MSESLLIKEPILIWFNVQKPIEFDESTARVRLLQNPPSTQNNITALNLGQEIRFELAPSTDQIIHLASKNTCLRLRCTFYTANNINGDKQGPNVPVNGVNGNSLNPNADITLESCFFGYLFNQAELLVGSGALPMDSIMNFPIWFQLMCHTQPLDFKDANGTAMGYLPDEETGLAVGNVNPYIPLVNISAAAVAQGGNGSFGIFATVTPTIAVAANGTVNWTIPGTNIILTLVAPAAIEENTTITGIFQLAAPFAFAAAGSQPYSFQGGCLVLTAGGAIAAGAAVNITMGNTTGSTLTNETVGINRFPASTAILQYPINAAYSNQNYEPGYFKRQKLYNSIPVGADGGRQFEVMIPLFYLFGFCNWFNRLVSNLSFQIKLTRTTNTNVFIGAPGTDGYFMINELYLQVCEIVPEDNYRVEFNNAIQRPIPVAFMSPVVQNDTINGLNISVLFRTSVYKPDFVFVIFKPDPTNQPSQTNGTLNINADVKELQILLNGELYPTLTQDCRWGGSSGSTSSQSVGVSKFYDQFQEVC